MLCHWMWVKITSSRKLWVIWIGQVWTLMYFAYYIYRGILFLSLLVYTDIAAKWSIQFVSYRNNNIIRSFENVSKWRMLFIKDCDFIHTRKLQYSNFKRSFFQTTQYEDISRATNLEKSMEINHIFLHSHRQDFEYLI